MSRSAYATMAIATATIVAAQSVAAQSSSLTFISATKARTVLAAALQAVGGLDAIETLPTITREYVVDLTNRGQLDRPLAPNERQRPNVQQIMQIRDYRTGSAIDVSSGVIPGGQPWANRVVLRGDTSFSYQYDVGILQRALPALVTARRARMESEEIESLLRSAWRYRGSGAPRWLGSARVAGRSADVVSFTDAGQSTRSIYIDSETHLPLMMETVQDDPIRGDVANQTMYSDWRPANSVKIPYKIENRLNDDSQSITRLVAVRFGPVDDSLWRVPPDTFVAPAPPTDPIAIGGDAFVIPNSYQSAFVMFDDYVLVLEPGGSPAAARSTIAAAKRAAPGKPIRYVVATHAHYDHLAGVREYIAIGATIVTTPRAKSIIERAATASHTLIPDDLSANPRASIIETFTDDSRVFRDANHEVRLYNLGPTPHVEAMLFAYIPASRTLFEGDALDIPEPGHVGIGGEDTEQLARRIAELNLDVDRIVPVHGRIGTLSDLKTAVGKRRSANVPR
jgi:glyoxylase-like metal-dependent hydrolase (beta-lactamase superfamily II)